MRLPTLSLHLLELTQNTDLVNIQLRKLTFQNTFHSLEGEILKKQSLTASNLNLFAEYFLKQKKNNGQVE